MRAQYSHHRLKSPKRMRVFRFHPGASFCLQALHIHDYPLFGFSGEIPISFMYSKLWGFPYFFTKFHLVSKILPLKFSGFFSPPLSRWSQIKSRLLFLKFFRNQILHRSASCFFSKKKKLYQKSNFSVIEPPHPPTGGGLRSVFHTPLRELGAKNAEISHF